VVLAVGLMLFKEYSALDTKGFERNRQTSHLKIMDCHCSAYNKKPHMQVHYNARSNREEERFFL
jgi:hypothetical protein